MFMAMNTTIQKPARKCRVFIVDDHPIVRHGVTRLLNSEEDMIVCGDVESGKQALEAIERLRPDAIIVDITLKDMDGLHLTEMLHSRYPAVPIVILSMHDEQAYAHKALRVGAYAYVMKEESSEKLVNAIRHVIKGELFVSDSIQKHLLRAYAGIEKADSPTITSLSNREREVFLMIGAGHTVRSIAQHLCVSIKTIETHRSRIKEKLNLNNSAQLALSAIEWAKRENITPIIL